MAQLKQLLLDTDMLSEILKAVDANVVARAKAYHLVFGILEFTSPSVLEIFHGLHRKAAISKIQRAEALFLGMGRLCRTKTIIAWVLKLLEPSLETEHRSAL